MTATKSAIYTKSQPKLETIKPEDAQAILARNTNNRSLNTNTVRFYQKQMEQGKWDINGETIKIADDGQLLDGQHRLEACVRSCVPLVTYVVRDLSPEVFKSIDAGKVRSHADYLKIDGKEGALATLAAAARIAMGFNKETGEYKYVGGKLPTYELLGFVEKHEGLQNSVRMTGDGIRKVMSPSIAAGCHYIFSIIDPEGAQVFFESLASGANLKEGSPILALRNRLVTIRLEHRAGSAATRMIVAYMVQGFNYWRGGKSLKQTIYSSEHQIVLNDFAGSML